MTIDRVFRKGLLEKGSDSDDLKAAAKKVFGTNWQRCRLRFRRNAMVHVGVKQRPMVSAALSTAFAQETKEAAYAEWRAVAYRLRQRFLRLSKLMDEAERDGSPTWPSSRSTGRSCT